MARKKGLEGYVRADGSPQPKEEREQLIEPVRAEFKIIVGFFGDLVRRRYLEGYARVAAACGHGIRRRSASMLDLRTGEFPAFVCAPLCPHDQTFACYRAGVALG